MRVVRRGGDGPRLKYVRSFLFPILELGPPPLAGVVALLSKWKERKHSLENRVSDPSHDRDRRSDQYCIALELMATIGIFAYTQN
jgi:hypothetical protein